MTRKERLDLLYRLEGRGGREIGKRGNTNAFQGEKGEGGGSLRKGKKAELGLGLERKKKCRVLGLLGRWGEGAGEKRGFSAKKSLGEVAGCGLGVKKKRGSSGVRLEEGNARIGGRLPQKTAGRTSTAKTWGQSLGKERSLQTLTSHRKKGPIIPLNRGGRSTRLSRRRDTGV